MQRTQDIRGTTIAYFSKCVTCKQRNILLFSDIQLQEDFRNAPICLHQPQTLYTVRRISYYFPSSLETIIA